jgi:hypothetical protein
VSAWEGPSPDRIVVVAPNYQQARSELSELHPNSWCYVSRPEGLRGRTDARLLILDEQRLSPSQHQVVREATQVHGCQVVALSSVAPRAAARAEARKRAEQ